MELDRATPAEHNRSIKRHQVIFIYVFLLVPQAWATAQVSCDGKTDNSPYLNGLTVTGGDLLFPIGATQPCVVALASTWNISNQQSFTIDGQARCGLPASCPRFKWIGSAGGTILKMENVQGVLIQNLAFDGAGLAAKGVIIDETSNHKVATQDVIFQGDEFDGNYPGDGAPNANWVGLSISPTSTINVNDIRVIDSGFACRGTGSGAGTIGVGIGLTNSSQNALQEVIRHNSYTACGYGIWQKSGGAIIEENTFGGDSNAIDDIRIDGSPAGQERVARNWSESQYGANNQFLWFNTAGGASIEISANQIPINGQCAVDVGGNYISSTQANQWYVGSSGGGGKKVCSTTNTWWGFLWSGPSGLAWNGTSEEDLSGAGVLNGIFYPGSIDNGPSAGFQAISYNEVPMGSPVKWAVNATITGTQVTDAELNIVAGVAANQPATGGRRVYVMTSGYIIMQADGNCAVGQIVQVSPTNNNHVVCSSTPTKGTIIGEVLQSEMTGGGPVSVQLGLSPVWVSMFGGPQ
jgi:hypothetical protein